MTATNHALTGAFIGLAVGNPWLAIPAAFVSHFICDAIPHYGKGKNNPGYLRSRFFRNMLVVDACLCCLLVVVLIGLRPEHWLLAAVCAFAATSPDLVWIGKFMAARAGQKIKNGNYFTRFAAWIQWFQKPAGAVVEVAWAIAMLVLLLPFLR